MIIRDGKFNGKYEDFYSRNTRLITLYKNTRCVAEWVYIRDE